MTLILSQSLNSDTQPRVDTACRRWRHSVATQRGRHAAEAASAAARFPRRVAPAPASGAPATEVGAPLAAACPSAVCPFHSADAAAALHLPLPLFGAAHAPQSPPSLPAVIQAFPTDSHVQNPSVRRCPPNPPIPPCLHHRLHVVQAVVLCKFFTDSLSSSMLFRHLLCPC